MATCYGYTSLGGSIFPFALIKQCPGSTQCCVSGDTCLSNGICQFTNSQPAGNYSGYYVSGCTDPTYNDATCIKQCTSPASANDVVFNYTSALWACCGKLANGEVACNQPTSETFSAPAPGNLVVLGVPSSSSGVSSSKLSSSSSSSSSLTSPTTTLMPTSVTSPTATPTQSGGSASATSTPQNHQSLNTGAIAGIVVGVVLGSLFVLSIVLWFVMRRRRRQNVMDSYPRPLEKDGKGVGMNQAYYIYPQELSDQNGTRRYELNADSNRGTQMFSQSSTTTK